MPRRSPFALAAVALLFTGAFGGLSVGVPLLVAQLASSKVAILGPEVSLVPAIALAYGLLSIAGAVGVLVAWRRATLLVVVPQGLVALGLLAVYFGIAADWSLLVVATIAGGAALCALANAWLGGPRPGAR